MASLSQGSAIATRVALAPFEDLSGAGTRLARSVRRIPHDAGHDERPLSRHGARAAEAHSSCAGAHRGPTVARAITSDEVTITHLKFCIATKTRNPPQFSRFFRQFGGLEVGNAK